MSAPYIGHLVISAILFGMCFSCVMISLRIGDPWKDFRGVFFGMVGNAAYLLFMLWLK